MLKLQEGSKKYFHEVSMDMRSELFVLGDIAFELQKVGELIFEDKKVMDLEISLEVMRE